MVFRSSQSTRALTFHELGCEPYLAWYRGRLELLENEFHCSCAEFFVGVMHRRQLGDPENVGGHVVVTDHRDILGDS
ncbi:hypothetical protein BIU99_07735 [Plantibacter sp. MMLR14_011]|nr:hypothetical protein BIU99_07735 [Plantibacter sp. MMLR14_011]